MSGKGMLDYCTNMYYSKVLFDPDAAGGKALQYEDIR